MSDLVWRYIEKGTDRIIDIPHGWTMQPLGYQALVGTKSDQPTTLPVEILTPSIVDSHGVAPANTQYTVAFDLNTDYVSSTIGLVPGGWLPAMSSIVGRMVLVDRNAVSEIRSRFLGGAKVEHANRDFVDFMSNGSVRINPILYAIEGNKRRHSHPHEVAEQLQEAYRKIRAALPLAVIEPGIDDALRGAIGLLQDSYAGMQLKSRFLKVVSPLLTPPASKKTRLVTWNRILAEADRIGLPRQSLVVLACLSCLACPQSQNPAKKVLKPKFHFNDHDAYNALCDIRALEIFIASLCLYPGRPLTLLTQDRNLALFWTGLQIHDFAWKGRAATYRIALDTPLLPDLSEAEFESLQVATPFAHSGSPA